MPIGFLMRPDKRIFWPYLISSFVMAYLLFLSKAKDTNFKSLFTKELWLGNSARVDYLFIFFNSWVKIFLIGPFLIYGSKLAFYTNEYLLEQFGYCPFNLSTGTTIAFYTLALFLVGDFASFFVHYLMHRIPFLWAFHKTHHSATSLNPITQYRIHPVELLINNAKGILIFGLVTGLFDYLSDSQLQKFTVFGNVSIFGFLFLLFGANLRHSPVRLTYPHFLERWIISPFQHQIHHSEDLKHHNKNMGSKLAIWDRWFDTLVRSKGIRALKFGIGPESNTFYRSFLGNLWQPFVDAIKSLLPTKKKAVPPLKRPNTH